MPAVPSVTTMAPTAATAAAARTPSGVGADLGRLLETKEGADVDFKVGGEMFAAHKVVLAARSSVFKADFFGPRKEMTTSYIRVSGLNLEAFKGMLQYIYTGTLPEMPPFKGLLQAAERYDLKDLKSLTETKMCTQIKLSTVFPMLALAEQHQCRELKEKCLKFIVSDDGNTRAAIEADDVEHLARTCPSVVEELIAKILDTNDAEGRAYWTFIAFLLFLVFLFFLGFCVAIITELSTDK